MMTKEEIEAVLAAPLRVGRASEYTELRHGDMLIVPRDGGNLRVVDHYTGEIMAEIPMQEGRHSANDIVAKLQSGQRIELDEGMHVLPPNARMSVLMFPPELAFASAARTDYVTTDASRADRIRKLAKLEQTRSEQRQLALAMRMERAAQSLLAKPAEEQEEQQDTEDEQETDDV